MLNGCIDPFDDVFEICMYNNSAASLPMSLMYLTTLFLFGSETKQKKIWKDTILGSHSSSTQCTIVQKFDNRSYPFTCCPPTLLRMASMQPEPFGTEFDKEFTSQAPTKTIYWDMCDFDRFCIPGPGNQFVNQQMLYLYSYIVWHSSWKQITSCACYSHLLPFSIQSANICWIGTSATFGAFSVTKMTFYSNTLKHSVTN